MTSLEGNITCEGNTVGKPDIILLCILERVILQGSRAEYYHTCDMLSINEISNIAHEY